MSVENSNHTAPIHLDDDAEKEVAQPSTIAEEQKADLPAVQEESPANKRIHDFATRANLAGKEDIDRKKLVLLAVGCRNLAKQYALEVQKETGTGRRVTAFDVVQSGR